MIHFQKVSKTFGRQRVLHEIDASFEEPGIYAILGPNGSGKTTLIKTLMGMVRPDGGDIHFRGKVLQGENAYRKHIAYLPQVARFPENLSVKEFFHLIGMIRGKPDRMGELLDLFGINAFLNKKLRQLSGGMRQKVNITSAMMYDTPVLVLDEPTIGLDPVAMLALKKWIKRERDAGKIILLTTHVLDVVEELADEILFILEGKVYYRGDQQNLLHQTGTSDVEHAIAHLLEGHGIKEVSHA